MACQNLNLHIWLSSFIQLILALFPLFALLNGIGCVAILADCHREVNELVRCGM